MMVAFRGGQVKAWTDFRVWAFDYTLYIYYKTAWMVFRWIWLDSNRRPPLLVLILVVV